MTCIMGRTVDKLHKMLPSLFLFVIMLIAYKRSLAQYDPMFDLSKNEERYIFTDIALIRTAPSVGAPISDTLFLGDLVRLNEYLRDSVHTGDNGINAFWGKVGYEKNGEAKEGYMWVGQMSMPPLRRGTMKFIYGIDSADERSLLNSEGLSYDARVYYMKIKAVEDRNVIAEDTFSTTRLGTLMRSRISGGKGLENVKYITSFEMAGEYCGAINTTFTHLWDGERFTTLPVRLNGGDVDYIHDEFFIFPADKGGKQGRVIWQMEETEFEQIGDEFSDKGEVVQSSMKTYRWDGKELL